MIYRKPYSSESCFTTYRKIYFFSCHPPHSYFPFSSLVLSALPLSSLLISALLFSSSVLSSPASLTIVDSTYKIHSTHSTRAVRTIITVRTKQRNSTIQLKSGKTMNEFSILLARYLS